MLIQLVVIAICRVHITRFNADLLQISLLCTFDLVFPVITLISCQDG